MSKFTHAFVTGASSGIGRALACCLASNRVHVIVAARREAELQSLVASLRAQGGSADLCVLDVSSPDEVEQAVRHWDTVTGGLDLLIANAGVGAVRPAHKLVWKDDIEPVLRVNVLGAFATLHAGMQVMLPRGRGTLAGVSSLASLRGLPTSGAYSASKAALATFLETMRLDLASKGLTVVDIRPGFVDTPMTRVNKIWMPQLQNVETVAQVALAGLERGDAIVSCPKGLAAVMSLAESIPDRLYRAIASRVRF